MDAIINLRELYPANATLTDRIQATISLEAKCITLTATTRVPWAESLSNATVQLTLDELKTLVGHARVLGVNI